MKILDIVAEGLFSPLTQRIQKFLISKGYDLGPTGADGINGPFTRAAIKKYTADTSGVSFGDNEPNKDSPGKDATTISKDTTSKDTTSKDTASSSSEIMPTKGRISGPYGRMVTGPKGNKIPHPGVDIAAPTGTPVVATNDGKIAFAGMLGSAGNTVELVTTTGVKHKFMHLSKILVKKGDEVKKGDRVGDIGSTGFSTGPHLHWEKYASGRQLDPLAEGEKKGLYYYVNKRKKAGTSRPASHPKAPTAQAWKDAAKTAKKEDVAEGGAIDMMALAKRAKALLDKGMSEQQAQAELVKQGIPARLAAQAVQMAQMQETVADQLTLESPISATDDPMDPMIHSHNKANPMTLKGRILQTRKQLQELAQMAESDDLGMWLQITKLAKGGMFMGLEQNLEQVRHGLEELAAKRKRGGIQSRGIEKFDEEASASTTNSGNFQIGAVYKNTKGKTPKNKDGTAKNALDMKANLLTGGSIAKR